MKIYSLFFLLIPLLFLPSLVSAEQGQCSSGYNYEPWRGVDCAQANCDTVDDAHYGSTGHCVCGSSGSMYENDKDPNQECSYPLDYEPCPGCVYACVGLKETCPDPPGLESSESNTQDSDQAETRDNSDEEVVAPCQDRCDRLFGGRKGVDLLEVSGEPPHCKCIADYYNDKGLLTQTVIVNGDKKTTKTFDTKTGEMKNSETISFLEEKERILAELGYKYTQEEIDKLLDDKEINDWFDGKMANIKTETRLWHPNFWWQHILAIFNHGFSGADADFVDTYQFGRCGDSMAWLENELAGKIDLPTDTTKRQEAMLSITGEKGADHTALLIRPAGISNIEWADIVDKLTRGSDAGFSRSDLEAIDPKLLNAKVLDPYFKKVTTVEEFIKGWSNIKIS